MWYSVSVRTGARVNAGTDAQVSITLHGKSGQFSHDLPKQKKYFEESQIAVFPFTGSDVGELIKIDIGHDNTGSAPGWFLEDVVVRNVAGQAWYFPCHRWLASDEGDKRVSRTLFHKGSSEYFSQRPIYIIAHRCNDLAKINKAVDGGANAIECDVRYDDGTWYVNHDFAAGTRLPEWLVRIKEQIAKVGDQFALLIFDIKTAVELESLVNIVRAAALPEDLDLLFSIAEYKNRSAFFPLRRSLRQNEGLAIDFHDNPIEVQSYLADGLGVMNVWFGNGINAANATDGNVRASLQEAAGMRDTERKFKKTYAWTLENINSIDEYINTIGVDGVMVNLDQHSANSFDYPLTNARVVVEHSYHVRKATRRDGAFRYWRDSPTVKIQVTPSKGIREGERYLVSFAASDPPYDPHGQEVNITFTSLPRFASRTGATGSPSYFLTPDYDDAGQHRIEYEATGRKGARKLGGWEFTVKNTYLRPVLEPIGPISVDEGARVVKELKASDPEGGRVGFYMHGDPAAGRIVTLRDHDNGQAELIIEPSHEDAGRYMVQVQVRKPGGVSAYENVTITVNNVNRTPVIEPVRPISISEGNELVKTIRSFDPDHEPVKFSAQNLPRFAALTDNGNGTASLRLRPKYRDAGMYSLEVISTDPSGATDQTRFPVQVHNVLRSLPTKVTSRLFHAKEGMIEIKFDRWLPGLALQVQRLTKRGWRNIKNEAGGRAWFHETLQAHDEVRYTYGANTLDSEYRWLLYDKSEGLERGWAVSEPFRLEETGQHVTLTVTLPDSIS